MYDLEIALGRSAYLSGERLKDNPYEKYSMQWYAWRKGWLWASVMRDSYGRFV